MQNMEMDSGVKRSRFGGLSEQDEGFSSFGRSSLRHRKTLNEIYDRSDAGLDRSIRRRKQCQYSLVLSLYICYLALITPII